MAAKTITKGRFSTFAQSEIVQLTKRVKRILEETGLDAMPLAVELETARLAFDDAYQESKIKVSMSLEAEDEQVDKAYAVLATVAGALADTPNEAGAAARRIHEVIGRWENPTKLAYAREYGIIGALINALDLLDGSDFDITQTRYWFEALKTHYAAFMDRLEAVNTQKAGKELGATKATRKNWQAAYIELIDYLNMRLRYDSLPEIELAADKLNAMITEFKSRPRHDSGTSPDDA